MVTATDAESSSRRRAAHSVGAHLSILRMMLQRMKLERESLPAEAIGDRIVLDLRIRNVERDIDVVRRKLG